VHPGATHYEEPRDFVATGRFSHSYRIGGFGSGTSGGSLPYVGHLHDDCGSRVAAAAPVNEYRWNLCIHEPRRPQDCQLLDVIMVEYLERDLSSTELRE
jgi:hypothetical protein